MKIGLFWRVLPVYLLIVFLFALPIWQNHISAVETKRAAALAQSRLDGKKVIKKTIKGRPVRILLPSIDIDVPIVKGVYSGKQTVWTVASKTANYAENTVLPNNKRDKTLVYGHWTKSIFGKTKNLEVGDIAYVYTSNDHIFKYVYKSKVVVKPSDVEIFEKFKGKPGLVLMTCQGLWAEERRIMFFSLKEAK